MPVRKIETELSLGGEKAFNDAMKSANSNLKTLRTDMSAVSSEFRKNENSTKALTEKQKILRDQYNQQKEIVRALTERLKSVEEAYGKDSAQADKLRQQINSATVSMNKSEDALEDNEKELAKNIVTMGKFGRTVSTVASGAVENFSKIAAAAGALTTAGAAAVTGIAAIGVSALNTLTDYAAEAGGRAKDAYDTASSLTQKARESFDSGDEAAGLEYLRQANEIIDGIDADYLKFGNTLDSLSSSTTAAKDALGKILLPALQDLADEGTDLLNSFTADMAAASGDTEKQGEIIADYVTRAVDLIREKLPEFGQLAVELLEGLGEGIAENLPEILDDVLGIIDYILETVEEHAGDIGAGAAALISKLGSYLIEHGPDLLASGAALVANLIVGLVEHLPDLIKEIAKLPGKLIEAFKNANVDWGSIGMNIINGISEGLAAAWDTLVDWVSSAFSGLVDSIAGWLGIHSPSTVMRDRIGKNLAEGVGVGFTDEMTSVSEDMQKSMDESIPSADAAAFTASVDKASGAAGGSAVTNMGGINIVINGYDVRDDDELAEILSYKLQELLDRKGA